MGLEVNISDVLYINKLEEFAASATFKCFSLTKMCSVLGL